MLSRCAEYGWELRPAIEIVDHGAGHGRGCFGEEGMACASDHRGFDAVTEFLSQIAPLVPDMKRVVLGDDFENRRVTAASVALDVHAVSCLVLHG